MPSLAIIGTERDDIPPRGYLRAATGATTSPLFLDADRATAILLRRITVSNVGIRDVSEKGSFAFLFLMRRLGVGVGIFGERALDARVLRADWEGRFGRVVVMLRII